MLVATFRVAAVPKGEKRWSPSFWRSRLPSWSKMQRTETVVGDGNHHPGLDNRTNGSVGRAAVVMVNGLDRRQVKWR
jgi:hypothetical protein